MVSDHKQYTIINEIHENLDVHKIYIRFFYSL